MARLSLISGLFALSYLGLIGHLYHIQVMRGASYVALGRAQSHGEVEVRRGTILFADSRGASLPVATTKAFPMVYAAPRDVDDPQEAAHALADILGVPVDRLVEQLSSRDDPYELLARKVSEETAERVRGAGLRGIYVGDMPERYYPFGDLASHVLGFVGPSDESTAYVGRYGIEQFYDDRLSGRGAAVKAGAPLASGEDLALTIDPSIEREAERILTNLLGTWRATRGSIIVQDPRTGRILAMASLPSFNPNRYGEFPLGRFLNPAVQNYYEPGSVVKVLTMAAAIDSGVVTPDTTFYDTGSVTVSGRTIRNWDNQAHGLVTMANIIEKSINTGAVFAETRLGNEAFRSYLEKFGLGERTGVDFPGEVNGDLRQLAPAAPQVQFATAAYGQGITVTPLAMANSIAALANGGVLMRPYLNAELEPREIRRVVAAETADQITAIMTSAVDRAGVAAIKGYALAGKTGTAFIPDFLRGGYTDRVINTYAGFGPVSDPRFVILIKLDDPEGKPVAALTVVPAFRELAQFIINYYDIAPDRITE